MTSSFRHLLSFIALAQTVVSSTISKTGPVSQGRNGAVVGEEGRCTAVGASIMEEQNGNAADAVCKDRLKYISWRLNVTSLFFRKIIATALCTGVIAAYHSGIGGGGFML